MKVTALHCRFQINNGFVIIIIFIIFLSELVLKKLERLHNLRI